MNLHESTESATYRATVRSFLVAHLPRGWRGIGALARDEAHDFLAMWRRTLYDNGFLGIAWPVEYGGQGLSKVEQVVLTEECAKAGVPTGIPNDTFSVKMLGNTLLRWGTEEQKRHFLPRILSGDDIWCQGYSEPNAGSDLAGVRTRAVLDGDDWLITGQKVWTSLAHLADWCFVLARSDPGSARHHGLTYLLCPMRQPGVDVRPIRQLTGTSEFNEVFFDGARTASGNAVGVPGDGWRVAMGTLSFERGVATLGQQIAFSRELARIVEVAQANGAIADPALRDRLTGAWVGLQVMRCHALRTLGTEGHGASVTKLYWSTWHQRLGELAMEVLGADGTVAAGWPYELDDGQRLFLFTRADTIYGGSNEIQRNVIAERILGLPREPRSGT